MSSLSRIVNMNMKLLTESNALKIRNSTEQRERPNSNKKYKQTSNNDSLLNNDYQDTTMQVNLIHKQIVNMKKKTKRKQKEKYQTRRIHNKSLPDAVLGLMINETNLNIAKPHIKDSIKSESTPKKMKKINSDKEFKFKKVSNTKPQNIYHKKDKLYLLTQLKCINNNDPCHSKKLVYNNINIYNPKINVKESSRQTQQNLIQQRHEKYKQKRFFNTSVSFDRTIEDMNSSNFIHQFKSIDNDIRPSPSPKLEQKREREKNYLKRKAVNKKFDIIKEEDDEYNKQRQIINNPDYYHSQITPQFLAPNNNNNQSNDNSLHVIKRHSSSRLQSLNKEQQELPLLITKSLMQTQNVFKETLNSKTNKKTIKTCTTPLDLSCVIIKSPNLLKEDLQKALNYFKIRFKSPTVNIITFI